MQQKIIDYKLINGPHEFFSETVDKYIAMGYQPYGSPTKTSYKGYESFAQAVIKYAEQEEI